MYQQQFPQWLLQVYQADIYLFKISNQNARRRCKLGSKLTLKTPERRYWYRSDAFVVNFDETYQIV